MSTKHLIDPADVRLTRFRLKHENLSSSGKGCLVYHLPTKQTVVMELDQPYPVNQKDALMRFLEDGRLGPDNNRAELNLRQVAVGRVNWQFAGSHEGGRRAAILYSLVASCKEIGVDPSEYLREVIGRLATTPVSQIRELTPVGWKAAREQQVASEV